VTGLSPALRANLRRQGVRTAQPVALERLDTTDEALRHAETVVLSDVGVLDSDEAQTLSQQIAATIGSVLEPDRLALYVDEVTFAPNDILIRQGDVADAMYFITQGSVSAYLERPGKDTIRILTAGAGTLAGEIGICTGERRTATVRVETTCVAQRLSLSSIRRMEQVDPHLANMLHRFLATVLAIRLRTTTRLVDRLSG